MDRRDFLKLAALGPFATAPAALATRVAWAAPHPDQQGKASGERSTN